MLAIKGSITRLGVTLPSEITVLRGELTESRRKFSTMIDRGADDPTGKRMHRIRNWLHVANLRMDLIHRYLEADRVAQAADLIQKVLDDFRMIDDDGSSHFPRASATASAPEAANSGRLPNDTHAATPCSWSKTMSTNGSSWPVISAPRASR